MLQPSHPDSPSLPSSAPSGNVTVDVGRLFREHNTALLRFISAKLGSEQEAREIVQEAYVHMLQLDHPEAVGFLQAFLYKTAANLAVDRLRQRGRRHPAPSAGERESSIFELSPERQVAGEQALEHFHTIVEELPAKCRQAFLLHRVYELDVDEVALRMNIGACMVRRYVARALEYVRFRFDQLGHGVRERGP